MYCEFFGFKESPFNITPDPRFIFLSKNHQETFAHLLYGIQQHSGFIEIIGEVGTGKTTVLRALLGQLEEERYRIALIFNPCLSAQELLCSINREYGLAADHLSTAKLLDELNGFLLAENAAGRTVVLVIDEAQNLDARVLEQIRLISNLETESDKLIQIVLAGQPELARLLEAPELRQLSQRITVRHELFPMDFDDTCTYINHRMELAGGWRAATFEEGALKRIFRYSGGLPRLINVICDRALLIGFTQDSRNITHRMADEAITEISRGSRGTAPPLPWRKAAAIAAAVSILTGAIFFAAPRGKPKAPSPPLQQARTLQVSLNSPAAKTENVNSPELLKSLRAAQEQLSETQSAVRAFNVLGSLWEVKPIRQLGGTLERGLERAAAVRGLQFTSRGGRLEQLLQTDIPLILQVSVPGMSGYRYLALTQVENGKAKLEPPLPSPNETLPLAAIESIWSGKAFLVWKNYLDISPIHLPETKGEHVRLLQLLLQKTGNYGGRLNGIFDPVTVEALKAFQSAQGTSPDGKLTEETLLRLYRKAGGFTMPGLRGKGQPA